LLPGKALLDCLLCQCHSLPAGKLNIQIGLLLASVLGALVKDSVTKDLAILVCGDKPSAAKVRKAKEHGARILSEKEFYDLLQEVRKGVL